MGEQVSCVSRRRQRGLTLYELLVAVAIAALLATLAVPGFAGLRRSAGISAAANELIWALHMARSSAAVRGAPVTVCLTGDSHTCVPTPDSAAVGWLVFQPEGQSKAAQPLSSSAVLHTFHLPSDITVSGSRPSVTFWPVARAGSTSTFELCDVESRSPGRSIIVSQTGRPRVAMEAATCAR